MVDRKPYTVVLEALGLPDALAAFDARVVGTPPLGLDVASSDIDLICRASDAEAFIGVVKAIFGQEEGFTISCRAGPPYPIIVNFTRSGWPIELYAIDQPIGLQPGWLHFDVERRLLRLGGDALKRRVRERRASGEKTEPAFAHTLHLPGDPFQALLELSRQGEDRLAEVLATAGYSVT
jgi:hypothetical protein